MSLFNRLKDYESKLDEDLPLVYDVETDSKEEMLANLYGFGVCFSDKKAFYIPWRKQDGKFWWTKEQAKEIEYWLHDTVCRRGVVGHNIIYDILVTEKNLGYNFEDHIVADTILMKHTLEEEPPFALKEIAVKELGEWADKAQQTLKDEVIAAGGKWKKSEKEMYLASTETLGEYCCWDVILTKLLYDIYHQRIVKEGLDKLFYEEEVMPLYKEVTIDMKRRGFTVDVDYFLRLKRSIESELNIIELNMYREVKESVQNFERSLLNKEFPIKKTGNFPKVLAQIIGAPLPQTKAGKITMAAKALQKQKEATPQFDFFYDWVLGERLNLSITPVEQVILEPSEIFGIGPKLSDEEAILLETQKKMWEIKYKTHRVFNFRSNDHLSELFFNIKGLKPLEKTPGGKSKINDTFIELAAKKDTVAEKLSVYKKLNKLLSTYVEGILARQINGVIYTSMLQFGTTSGRFSSRNPNCLSLDTEILTDSGWKKYDKINYNAKVATFDGKKVIFDKPTNIYLSDNSLKTIINIKNQHIDMKLTDNHRVVWQNRKTLEIKKTVASKFPKDGRILHGNYYNSKEHGYNKNWLKLLVAIQADAEIRRDTNKIRFKFTKKRKFDRLLEILDNFKYSKEIKIKNNIYEVKISGIKNAVLDILTYSKTFPARWITLGKNERSTILNEIFYWDGLYGSQRNYSSNNEDNVDLIQALCSLHGWRAHKRIYRSLLSKSNNYQLDITQKNYSGSINSKITSNLSREKVWCVTVNSGMILVRRGSDTFITGNCQNLPRPIEEKEARESGISPTVLKYGNSIRAGFIAPKGYKIVDADYSSLEPRCFSFMSGDDGLKDVYSSGEDLYSRIAIDVFKVENVSADPADENYLKKVHPELRQRVKKFCLSVPYVAEESRISKEMGVSWKEAHDIIQAYLNAYPNLKKYMAVCNYEAKHKGYVKTEFGRVRHLADAKAIYVLYGDKILDYKWANKKGLNDIRRKLKTSLNNAKNFKIQGLAAHIVNRAMIAIARAFKEADIDGWIALQVHDQVIAVVREDQTEKAKAIVQHCMEKTTTLSIPMIAEPVIANNLKDSH